MDKIILKCTPVKDKDADDYENILLSNMAGYPVTVIFAEFLFVLGNSTIVNKIRKGEPFHLEARLHNM